MSTTGNVIKMTLKDVFENEARNFTPWLCRNIDQLGEVVELELSDPSAEKQTDNFRCDIIATVGNDESNNVAIENQYGASNHDHLGKLLAYSSTFNSKAAIWIVEQSQTEHITAINELNKYYGKERGFYLVEASVIKIDDSLPAVVFTVVCKPSDEIYASEMTEGEKIRYDFWAKIIEKSKSEKFDLYSGKKVHSGCFTNSGAGKQGIFYCISIGRDAIRISISFDSTISKVLQLYKQIEKKRPEVEQSFGEELDWLDDDTRKYNQITFLINEGGYRSNKEDIPEIIANLISYMQKFENTFKPLIQKI